MTVTVPRNLLTGALAVLIFYGLLGVEVQCVQAEARPSLGGLQTQIDELRAGQLWVYDVNGVEIGPLAATEASRLWVHFDGLGLMRLTRDEPAAAPRRGLT